MVIQDVSASNDICMGKICDLTNYPNMVPHVKKVSIYEEEAMKDVSTLLLEAYSRYRYMVW